MVPQLPGALTRTCWRAGDIGGTGWGTWAPKSRASRRTARASRLASFHIHVHVRLTVALPCGHTCISVLFHYHNWNRPWSPKGLSDLGIPNKTTCPECVGRVVCAAKSNAVDARGCRPDRAPTFAVCCTIKLGTYAELVGGWKRGSTCSSGSC